MEVGSPEEPVNADFLNIFNPVGSGKTFVFKEIIVSATKDGPFGFDLRMSGTPGAGCRILEPTNRLLATPTNSSSSLVTSGCSTDPTLHPRWQDNYLLQFTAAQVGVPMSLVKYEVPEGMGMLLEADTPGLTAADCGTQPNSCIVQIYIAWEEK